MFLTIPEICEKYNVTRRYIDDAINNGELDAYQFSGKTKHIKEKDFLKWVETKKYLPKKSIDIIRYKNFARVK
jgi:excisionase family DNA binding protein